MIQHERRQEKRFKVRNGQLLDILIQQFDGEQLMQNQAELRDISEGGAQLLLSEPALLYEAAVVTISSQELNLELAISADVCWMQPRPDGRWVLGCSFVPRLPTQVLETLFLGGAVERRDSARQSRCMPILAKWENNPTHTQGFLWDVSEGGFCMLSPCKSSPKVSVLPQHSRPRLEVAGQTQWELRMSGGFVVGCRFSSQDGFALMERMQQHHAARLPSSMGLLQRAVRRVTNAFAKSIAVPAECTAQQQNALQAPCTSELDGQSADR